jgi:low affinity Fe/Cu permease
MTEFVFGEFKKPFSTVLVEAGVIGFIFIFISLIFFSIFKKVNGLSTTYQHYIILGVASSLFHFVCEYSGINVWYSKNYCKMY